MGRSSMRVVPWLLMILVNQARGQGSLMQGFWDFAQSAGVDPNAPVDAGAFPPETGATQTDAGAFPPDLGATATGADVFPPDFLAVPTDTGNAGAFPPNLGGIPLDTGVPPDAGMLQPEFGASRDTEIFPSNTDTIVTGANVIPPTANVLPLDTSVAVSGTNVIPPALNVLPQDTSVAVSGTNVILPAANILPQDTSVAGSGTNLFPPAANFLTQDSGAIVPDTSVFPQESSLTPTDNGKPLATDPVVLALEGGQLPFFDPFGVEVGSPGNDLPSTVPKASISIGMVDLTQRDSQSVPVSTTDTRPEIIIDGAAFGVDSPGTMGTSTNLGTVDIASTAAGTALPADSMPVFPPENKKDTAPIIQVSGQDVGPAINQESVIGPESGQQGPLIGAGFLPNLGTLMGTPVAQGSFNNLVDTSVSIPASQQSPGSQTLNPSLAKSFLESLGGPSFIGGEAKPKVQPPSVIPAEWTQLYPDGWIPNKVKPGKSETSAISSDPVVQLSEIEKQMALISNQSFGKHRSLYLKLRKQRKERKKALRKQQQQERQQNNLQKKNNQRNMRKRTGPGVTPNSKVAPKKRSSKKKTRQKKVKPSGRKFVKEMTPVEINGGGQAETVPTASVEILPGMGILVLKK